MVKAKKKAKEKANRKIKKGTRSPGFVKIKEENKCTHLHFPVAAHPIEKRLMVFFLILSIAGFSIYGHLKPETALLTEGLIPYQIGAFLTGCVGLLKFLSLIAGRFYIRLGKVTIDLYYGPLAKRKLHRLHAERLDQIYVEQIETLFGYKYEVKAITKSHKESVIYVTYHNLLAKYIEFTLEEYLGITNRPVEGEFLGIKKTENHEYL